MDLWRILAEEMVSSQIMARGVIFPPVLEAMRTVPRHLFVPPPLAENAYIDSPLPIGHDQTISQPYMVARMTELLAPERGKAVLEIGTGSGYQAAVLAAMGAQVTSMERIEELARSAKAVLNSLGYPVKVIWSDGTDSFRPEGPFSGILVTAGAPEVEEWWNAVLLPGGRLVAPIDVISGGQRVLLREKTEDGFLDTWHDYCRFVPLLKGRRETPFGR